MRHETNWFSTALGLLCVHTALTAAPITVSVNPNSGQGSQQKFTATYADANGSADLQTAYFLINTTDVDKTNSCFVQYVFPSHTFYILNDAATSWTAAPSGGNASNSQCSLIGSGSSASTSGNTATVVFSIAFKPAFVGFRNLYLRAVDFGQGDSGYDLRGSYTVMPPPPSPPITVSVNPNSGQGSQQKFTATYADANGSADLQTAYFLINTTDVDKTNSCFVQYVFPSNTFYILNDAATSWAAAPSGGNASNSQCSLIGSGSSASTSGNTATVVFSIAFKPAFVGFRNLYLRAVDMTQRDNGGYDLRGSYTVMPPPPSPPITVSVNPNSGQGSQQKFTATYADANGGADLQTAYFLINRSDVDKTHSCFVQYVFQTNTFYILNDAATSWTAVPGTGAFNSQCFISGGGSSASISGNTATVVFAIAFKPAFVGSKNLYLRAVDMTQRDNGGYDLRGSYTVTTQ